MIINSANRWIALFAIGTVVLTSIGNSIASAQQTTRIWSDDSGSFSIEAKLLKINASSVQLEKLNGIEIEVPFARLSKFDIEIVEKLKKNQQQTSTPKSAISTSSESPDPIDPVAVLATSDSQVLRPSVEHPETIRADRKRPTGNQKIAPRPAATSLVVSSQEIERLPEPYRSMAWQVMDTNNRAEIRAGLEALTSDWPRKKMPTLIMLVRRLAGSPNANIRKQVIDLLAKHDADEGLEYIVGGIDDKNFSVRWACYEWIEKLGDQRAIASLIRKLESDEPDLAAATLISFGIAAESQILPLIGHESTEVQMTACSLLSKIGSEKSIAILDSLVKNATSVKVRMQASNAIEQIKKRLQSSD